VDVTLLYYDAQGFDEKVIMYQSVLCWGPAKAIIKMDEAKERDWFFNVKHS